MAEGQLLDFSGGQVISGLDGNDTVIGTREGDSIFGNEGDDSVFGNEGDDSIDVSLGADSAYGGAGDDSINGGPEDDKLFGDVSNKGQGILADGFGKDIILGGPGNDEIFGNQADDILDGQEGDDSVWGGQDNDIVQGGSGNDWLNGNKGNDLVVGGTGNDTCFGGDGIDVLLGEKGDDFLDGGLGNDVIDAGVGNDLLFGEDPTSPGVGAGEDLLIGGEGNDTAFGGGGNDQLQGGPGNDQLHGNQGADTIAGGEGNDSAWGGQGNDQISGEKGDDVLQGNFGDDIISGGEGNDSILGNEGNDELNGNSGNDTVDGGTGNDVLRGGQGNDLVLGNEGNDTLHADRGADTLQGGAGSDQFVLRGGTNSFNPAETAIIADFVSGEDFIRLIPGLVFENLNIIDGNNIAGFTGSTILQNRLTGEALAVISGVAPAQVLRQNFLPAGAPEPPAPPPPPAPAQNIGGLGVQVPGVPSPPAAPPPPPASLQFSEATFSINEDGTPVPQQQIIVTRSGDSSVAVGATVNLNDITATGGTDTTATDGTVDFNNTAIAVNFAAGQNEQILSIPIVDDVAAEGLQTLQLQLANPTGGASLGAQNTATLEIVDNDVPGLLQFSGTDFSVNEDGSAVAGQTQVTVERVGGVAGLATAQISLAVGTTGTAATLGSDFNNNPITVTFLNGQAGSQTISIPSAASGAALVNDGDTESPETVALTLENFQVNGATDSSIQGTPVNATLTIIDDDLPTVRIEATDSNAFEATGSLPTGESREGVFTFTRQDAAGNAPTDLSSSLTVNFTVNAAGTGAAENGVDYNGNPAAAITTSVTIPANSTTATVNIDPFDDTLNEGNETVTFTITPDTANYNVASPGTAEVTIVDNDVPVVDITATDAAASEENNTANTGLFTVTRRDSAGNLLTDPDPLAVSITVSGSAVNGTDYDFITGGVTIPANASSTTIELRALDDTQVELNETATLTVNDNSTEYSVGTAEATVTIADNETPTVFVRASDDEAREGDLSGGQFTIRRGGDLTVPLLVNLAVDTDASTATAGTDYSALPTNVAFGPGEDRVNIPVTPLADGIQVSPTGETLFETIVLNVLDGTGYDLGLGPSQGIVFLENV